MQDPLTPTLLTNLCILIGQPIPSRQEIRVWSTSGVERVTFPDGQTAIFKYAKKPFNSEDQALRLAHIRGIPVPQVRASVVHDAWLGMLLEDLGTPIRDADDLDGAVAAVVLHSAPTSPFLPVLHEAGLRALPDRARGHLHELRKADPWQDTGDIEQALDQIAEAATARAVGAETPPFGWVHAEFRPTSLHIGPTGWRLLDMARAFTGPGLFDHASWHTTLNAPDPLRLRAFLECYVTAGGTPETLAQRGGGLAAETWALGWHRMWVTERFLEQVVRWINDPATDPASITVVRRHLTDVLQLLEV